MAITFRYSDYIAASIDPIRHWPVVLVGFLGKVFGPIGFIKALSDGIFPPAFALNIVFNDLIWWIPFFLILKATYLKFLEDQVQAVKNDQSTVWRVLDKMGLNLKKPILLINLRHSGCTFAREWLDCVAKNLERIKQKKWQIVFVHMSEANKFKNFASKYLPSDSFEQISDPDKDVYTSLGLKRGRLSQLFGPKEWARGVAGMVKGHGIGPLDGDGFQLAGMFLLSEKELSKQFRAIRASDRPPIQEWLE
ncbi:MAG: hypothetical protein HRU09_21050 [Oligoflexales bacterium]|nr:hypothetical protein [Oligoflexales bacterium]